MNFFKKFSVILLSVIILPVIIICYDLRGNYYNQNPYQWPNEGSNYNPNLGYNPYDINQGIQNLNNERLRYKSSIYGINGVFGVEPPVGKISAIFISFD